MTSLSKVFARHTGIVLTLLCIVVSGCSASKTISPLAFSAYSDEKWQSSPSGAQSDHVVELKSRDSSTKLKGFATALKSCGYDDSTSLRGASRQFFVGLEKIQITSQGPIEITPYQLWKVEAEAVNDGFPFSLATYTLKKDRCFFDFALWVPTPPENINKPDREKEIADLRGHFFTLVGSMVPKI